MKLFSRHDLVRQCTQCGTRWTVPGELARKRRKRRGISYRERSMFGPGSLTNASAQSTLDLANQRNQAADATNQVVTSLEACPSCGEATYEETRADRTA